MAQFKELVSVFSQDVYAPLALLAAVIGCLVFIWSKRAGGKDIAANSPSSNKVSKDETSKNTREYGEWNPIKFAYPAVQANKQHLEDIKPIPYRPFRWGTYNVTMGIRSMPWDDWIELDNEYKTYQRIRAHRIQTRGKGAICVLGDDANPGVVRGGEKAAIELVHELAEYLSRRYPISFTVVRHSSGKESAQYDWGWDNLPPVKSITVVPLNVSYELPLGPNDGERAGERAMEISALLVQDDLALMIEGVDGRYYFQAGAICVPGFWRMQDKIGLPLDAIHLEGNVPQYKEKLHTSMERFFRRLPVDKPVVRNNYFFQVVRGGDGGADRTGDKIDPEELGWSESTNGPEDRFEHGHPFNPPERDVRPSVESLRLRTERQTLRRLGRSGAVVFTIRTYVFPVSELGRERGVPGRMASAVRGWTADVGEYKGRDRGKWTEVLLEYLDGCHRAQVEGGMEEKAGDGGYPY